MNPRPLHLCESDVDVYFDRRIGLGTLPLAGPGGWGLAADPSAAMAVLRSAIALGIRMIDTAWYYGPDVVNRLLVRALSPYVDDLIIVAKVGNGRDPVTRAYQPQVGRGELHLACDRTLRTLEIDRLPLLLLRWRADLGLAGQFDTAWGTILELQAQGKAKHVGLSNVTLNHIMKARTVGDVAAVSNAYSVLDRSDQHVLRYCTQEGIWFLPYYPLNRGSVADNNELRKIAGQVGASPTQVALAWLSRQSPMVIPIPGTGNRDHLIENVGAVDLPLSEAICAQMSRLQV